MKRTVAYLCLVGVLLVGLAGTMASAQDILLDKGVKAGPLWAFPSQADPKTYYYLPDKAGLAVGQDGKPQFSFLKFVRNVKSAPGAASATEGEGGGIVHCLVQLGATPDQVDEASQELRRVVPGAKLAGPVMFKSGTFGLVTSFKQDDGDWTTKIVGLGSAPILDGEKAAISMRLTKEGARILWQSFQTATPDISFTFEMELSGYQSPFTASLKANLDQISSHQEIAASAAAPILGFQLRHIMDQMKEQKVIDLTIVGDDAKLEETIMTAYARISDLLFDKAEPTGLTSGSGGDTDLIDQAVKFLKADSGGRQPALLAGLMLPLGAGAGWEDVPGGGTEETTSSIQQQSESAPEETQKTSDSSSTEASGSDSSTDKASGSDTSGASSSTAGSGSSASSGSTGTKIQPKKTTSGSTTSSKTGGTSSTSTKKSTGSSGTSGKPTTGSSGSTAKPAAKSTSGSKTAPFAMLAAYKLKSVHRTGVLELNFRKFTKDTRHLRFDENIGNLSKLSKDPKHFREVNLDDPVFKQREICVYLDGQNAADFGNFVNYVTVRLRKTHEGGDQTNDEVRIDRANFNESGNFFKLLYGWKSDNNREKWMNYDYDTVWSFHGGKEIDLGWKRGSTDAITVAPPYLKRSIHVDADPDAIEEAEVRLITVKFYYKLDGAEQVKQVTLNPAKDQLSTTIEYVRPQGDLSYDYEIAWRVKGGTTINSGRKSSTDDYILCDEIPES